MSQRVDKDSLPLDQPRRTPNHPTKSHIVKTKVDGKEKIIRFGEQGASTAGKPKAGESDRMKQKRASFKSRHAKNIAKGKSSPAYWANKVKWAEGGEVKLARGGNAAIALLEQMRRSGQSPEFNAVEASLREQRARPRRSIVPPPQQRQAVPQPQPQSQAEAPLPLPPTPPAMRPEENPPPGSSPRNPMRFDEGNPHVATAIEMAQRYNLPRDIFLSLVQQESRFDPNARSPRGAIGLGQLMPGTARELGVDPLDPVQNLEGSARYLRQMLDRFGDMSLALAAYNAGPRRVIEAGNTIPNIRETQNYVPSILRRAGASVPERFAEGGRVRRIAGAISRAVRPEPQRPAPESMRVYHAGEDFDMPSPGLFTNPDRAAVENFQQQMRAPRLHEFEISPRSIAGEEDIYDVARRYDVYMPDTPAGQYLEQGENAVFGEAADILAELRRRGFDSARLNDGIGPEPSIVVLDPSIVRRYTDNVVAAGPTADTPRISEEEMRRVRDRLVNHYVRMVRPTSDLPLPDTHVRLNYPERPEVAGWHNTQDLQGILEAGAITNRVPQRQGVPNLMGAHLTQDPEVFLWSHPSLARLNLERVLELADDADKGAFPIIRAQMRPGNRLVGDMIGEGAPWQQSYMQGSFATRRPVMTNQIDRIYSEDPDYTKDLIRDTIVRLRRQDYAEGGLAELNSKYADDNVVTAYDPEAVEARIRSLEEPQGYAEGGEVMSDEEYDRRLLSRMKEQTGRVTEPTRAEQMQALRTAGRSAAEGVADVLLPQSPLDVALMVALGPGGRAARLAGAGALAALEPSDAEASRLRRLIRAYHGSPHKFDEFDIRKIGTGEGAQAYGRGLYFADSEDVARHYRNKLSSSQIETASGRLHPYSSSAADEIAGDLMVGANPQVRYPAEDAIGSLVRGQSLDNAIAQMRRNYEHIDVANLDEAERLLRQNNPRVVSSGHMYEVDLNASPREFLNWDAPLSQQAPEVRESLQRFGLRVDPEAVDEYNRLLRAGNTYGPKPRLPEFSPDPTGQEIYQRVLRMDPEEARIALMQTGIPGTRYLDAGSRGVGGTYNYAVFDPDIIDITRRYAQGGLAQLEQKYAEDGEVSVAQYDPAAVDALVKQIEAEYV